MRSILAIPILLLAGLGVYSFLARSEQAPVASTISSGTPALRAAQAYLLPVANPYTPPARRAGTIDPVLDANVALLMNPETGQVLYERNARVGVPIASLTKLMTALTVRDLFTPEEIMTVSSASVRVDGMKQTLYRDERITVRDATILMLVESSNDAAYALAAYARERGIDLVDRMNNAARELSLSSCVFKDPAGLDDTATCTAYDLIRLVHALMRRAPQLTPILGMERATVYSADGAIAHAIVSTNELFGQLEGMVGGKTGNTDGALGCMLVIVKMPSKDDTLVSVILGSRVRFQDTKVLMQWAREAYDWR